jgi:hypothetical protein
MAFGLTSIAFLNMTKENAKDYLPLVQALADGKEIQNCSSDGSLWYSLKNFDFTMPPSNYRIKPEPTRVPLGPEDVPPGSALRFKLATAPEPYWMITSVSSESIDIYSPRGFVKVGWDRALSEMEIKRPGQDWQGCYKFAES